MRPTAREQAASGRDGAVSMKGVAPDAWLDTLAEAVERGVAEPEWRRPVHGSRAGSSFPAWNPASAA